MLSALELVRYSRRRFVVGAVNPGLVSGLQTTSEEFHGNQISEIFIFYHLHADRDLVHAGIRTGQAELYLGRRVLE